MRTCLKKTSSPAFSLIEIVLALGITTFCLVALLGLFSVAIRTSRESAEELLAAHLAQSILVTRRSYPTNDLSATFPNFPLPPLASSAQSIIQLDNDGNKVVTNSSTAQYNLSYNISAPAQAPGPAFVYLRLTWPARATSSNLMGAYEVATQIPVP